MWEGMPALEVPSSQAQEGFGKMTTRQVHFCPVSLSPAQNKQSWAVSPGKLPTLLHAGLHSHGLLGKKHRTDLGPGPHPRAPAFCLEIPAGRSSSEHPSPGWRRCTALARNGCPVSAGLSSCPAAGTVGCRAPGHRGSAGWQLVEKEASIRACQP